MRVSKIPAVFFDILIFSVEGKRLLPAFYLFGNLVDKLFHLFFFQVDTLVV